MTATENQNLPTLVARTGWVARTATGLDLDGLRAAYLDADNDCWVYVGRAFSKSDADGLARAYAELSSAV